MAKQRAKRAATATLLPEAVPLKFDQKLVLNQWMLSLFDKKTFVDPKSLRQLDDGSSNPKVQFYRTIKDIEARLADPAVILNSFIVSSTPYQNIPMWGDGMTKAELQQCHVLFQRDDKETYINTLLTKVVAT
jgi:hypothetical protein